MTKKIIAIILALVLSFSTALTVCAATEEATTNGDFTAALKEDISRVESAVKRISELSSSLAQNIEPYLMDVVLTSENLQTATDVVSKVIIKLIEGSNSDKPEEPTEPDTGNGNASQITIAELKRIMESYIFVKVDDVDAATLKVLKGVKYYPVELDNGHTTVYIAVNIKDNPDLFNYEVFRNVVEQLYKKQGKKLPKDAKGDTDYLMSYEHIAGELAFHAIIYAVTNEIITVTGSQNETLLKLYDKATTADLNVDESRLPWQIFSIIGIVLTEIIPLKVFEFIKGI